MQGARGQTGWSACGRNQPLRAGRWSSCGRLRIADCGMRIECGALLYLRCRTAIWAVHVVEQCERGQRDHEEHEGGECEIGDFAALPGGRINQTKCLGREQPNKHGGQAYNDWVAPEDVRAFTAVDDDAHYDASDEAQGDEHS